MTYRPKNCKYLLLFKNHKNTQQNCTKILNALAYFRKSGTFAADFKRKKVRRISQKSFCLHEIFYKKPILLAIY